MKSRLSGLIIVAAMLGLLVSCMSMPTERHPNLVAAQEDVQRAITKISEAQKANDFDLGGHAAKARELLNQAMAQIRLAERSAANGS